MTDMKKPGVELIAIERARQQSSEGFDAAHDDAHGDEELALAACCYAAPVVLYRRRVSASGMAFVDPWPFDERWDKRDSSPAKRVDQLVKAGALIAAEIDRLQRAVFADDHS